MLTLSLFVLLFLNLFHKRQSSGRIAGIAFFISKRCHRQNERNKSFQNFKQYAKDKGSVSVKKNVFKLLMKWLLFL